MGIELLKKYCNNQCTDDELKSVLEWFEKSAVTPEGKSVLLKIWDEFQIDGDNYETDFDLLLGKIHHGINLEQSKKLLNISDQELLKYRRRERSVKYFTRAAAVLLLPVLIFGLYMFGKYKSIKNGQLADNQVYNEVFSSVDAITKVTLPDGSNVWLNHNSSLRYPGLFLGGSRTVELNGEGYFEVTHNSKKPFIVKAGEIQIKATGTTFNIMAYPDEDKVETSLINGKVELQRIVTEGKAISLVKMKPNDMTVFQKSKNEVITRSIDDDRYFSWKSGKLVFNKESISEVAKKLSRWFNVDIQIKDPELLDLTYTATFVHETLPQVMELLALVSPVSYSISDREETGSGTFTKRKIILNYNKNKTNLILKNGMLMNHN